MIDTVKSTFRKMGIPARFAVLVVCVVSAAAVVYLLWSHVAQEEALQNKALTEARTLSIEMGAVWDYISGAQNAINYNSDGTYDFKGIYCAVAGKGIARSFTKDADGYVIRYVRESPRNKADQPDEFEMRALGHFAQSGDAEYYGIVDDGNGRVFRYSSVLRASYACLKCHGEPAGQKDEVGYLKEGMGLGDIAGAVSITIPLAAYEAQAAEGVVRSVAVFAALAIVITTLTSLALRRWVTGPLAMANEVLKRDNAAKNDYLAAMSHELRTPLTAIITNTDIMERDLRQGKAQDPRLIGEMRRNSQVLLEMVNNTIDVAKLEEGLYRLNLEEFDPLDVVAQVESVVGPLAQAKGLCLEHRVGGDVPMMVSDADALYKILVNLASNAAKFTDQGGLAISIAPVQSAGGSRQISFKVSDTGIGIDSESQDHVFGKYAQAGFREAGARGSGLGLYLVRTLAEMMGGKVSVASTPGKGSVFEVVLPVDATTCRD